VSCASQPSNLEGIVVVVSPKHAAVRTDSPRLVTTFALGHRPSARSRLPAVVVSNENPAQLIGPAEGEHVLKQHLTDAWRV
jgi:hypothetical protein